MNIVINKLTALLFGICMAATASAQMDSIYDQGVWRTFIVHLPAGYSPSGKYPVVLSLHGLNSNAAQQESYSQFDNVADTAKFIVVYPNGINEQWSIGTNTDVDFISHLVDTIRNRYSCNSCLFSSGISDGGFMTYKLACALPQPLTAIAVVSGNMAKTLQSSCVFANGLPVMHFHGTADAIVSYNGVPPLIPPVDTTIKYWVNKNNCYPTAAFTALPDISTSDSCHVERYYYSGGTNGSSVDFYKIINGGHTWPGAMPAPPLGFTNKDISASGLMGSFFKFYCNATSSVGAHPSETISVFPVPASHDLTIINPEDNFDLTIIDSMGKLVFAQNNCSRKTVIDCSELAEGVYFLGVSKLSKKHHQTLLIVH